MPAILIIAFGTAFLAIALGWLPLSEQPPFLFNLIAGLIGALAIFAGLLDLRFRFRRRMALSGGLERDGTVRLRGHSDHENASAYLVFKTSYGEWLLLIDPANLGEWERKLPNGIKARAIMADNDRIYAIKIGEKLLKLQSAGKPFKGAMRAMVERAENRITEAATR